MGAKMTFEKDSTKSSDVTTKKLRTQNPPHKPAKRKTISK